VRLTVAGLPKARRFCTSKAALKRAFGDVDPLSVHMGSLGSRFSFDSRCPNQPALTGTVLASLSVSRALTAILQVYPIPLTSLGPAVRRSFDLETLLRMRKWLLGQLGKPKTAILGYETLVIELTPSGLREHQLRYL